MTSVAFTTLGCKVNQSETDLLARQFAAAGYECVPFAEAADVYVVNTCTVTRVSDRKSRHVLHQARRLNPEALVVATGCYVSVTRDALADDRTLLVRNRDKERLVALVEGRLARTSAGPPSHIELEKYLDVPGGQERSRAMVKVQDGCDSHCTYCIIPRARGRSRSLHPEEVVKRIQALVVQDHAEVVVTGVDLGSYGQDAPHLPDLGGLLAVILERTDVARVRVSSLEPGDFDPAWLPLWDNPRLCRHLHVPLQAGSDSVLARMERSYSSGEFQAMVASCREAIPGVTITTDVMVGFPGETEEEFKEGHAFIREVSFDGMHVFKYSARSGTRAARIPEQVPEGEKQERSRVLRQEASAGVGRLLARHVGLPAEVAWDGQDEAFARGMSDTGVRVYAARSGPPGQLSRVRLEGPFRDGLWAEPDQLEIPLVSVT